MLTEVAFAASSAVMLPGFVHAVVPAEASLAPALAKTAAVMLIAPSARSSSRVAKSTTLFIVKGAESLPEAYQRPGMPPIDPDIAHVPAGPALGSHHSVSIRSE